VWLIRSAHSSVVLFCVCDLAGGVRSLMSGRSVGPSEEFGWRSTVGHDVWDVYCISHPSSLLRDEKNCRTYFISLGRDNIKNKKTPNAVRLHSFAFVPLLPLSLPHSNTRFGILNLVVLEGRRRAVSCTYRVFKHTYPYHHFASCAWVRRRGGER